jgi:hypothetical protein
MRDLIIRSDFRTHALDERDYLFLVYDNPHTGERIFTTVRKEFAQRTCEALRGQGCPVGLWSHQAWQAVKSGLFNGRAL